MKVVWGLSKTMLDMKMNDNKNGKSAQELRNRVKKND